MNADLLSPLLAHFNARAQTFFTGNLCTRVSFPKENGVGYLHVFKGGEVELHEQGGVVRLREPMLMFYARPYTHRFEPHPKIGADLACATVSFAHQAFNPISLALPERFRCNLSELGGSAALLSVLFAEAFKDRPGRQEVLNRLFEVLLIELLRLTIARGGEGAGFLRGLGHPQLARTLTAIHSEPGREWTLGTMAEAAAMSRSTFAAAFKEHVGDTPGDYLMRWRISVAQALMRDGVAAKLVAERVGYASQPGFLRAFKLVVGRSPKAWLRESSE
jgi:AraC-like DNA-binding protein